MPRDYYEVLEVNRNASKDEIKKSFRRLARKWHPDINKTPEAETRFKEINEANEVLSDDDKRARYDRFGHAGVSGANGFGGVGATGFGGFEDIFEDFFNNFTGQRRGARQRGPKPGADRQVSVTISFEDSVFGVEEDVEFQRYEHCDICEGSGAREGSEATTCPECKGTGEVRNVQQTFIGSMVRVSTCPRCGGRGQVVLNPCQNCDGSGRRLQLAVLSVKIPAGVREGLQIQVRGEGDAGERGAPHGNLFVIVHVQEHEFFKRRGDDIILDISVNVAQATLGDKIMIPTVDGEVELAIPQGTQTGKVFRLRGKGVPRLRSDGTNSGRGDQMVYITVAIPTDLTEEQRELFEQLGSTLGGEIQPQANGRGFFDRVMDIFNKENS